MFRLLIITTIGALLLFFTGNVSAQTTATGGTIRVAAAPDDDFTPVLYAEHAGLFRAAGITLEIQRVTSGAVAINSVVGGAADIGMSDLVRLISAHAHQLSLVVFAPAGMYVAGTPQSGILVLRNSPIRSARDAVGKSVAVPGLAGISYLGTRAWADKNGADSKLLKFVEIPPPLVPAALDSGRIDVGTTTNPSFAAAVASGKYRLLGGYVEAISKRVLQTGWFTTPAYAAQHRDLIATFARVLRRSGEYTNRHHDETVDLVSASTGIDPALIRQMDRGVPGTTLNASEVQPLIDAAAEYKIIDNRFLAQEMFLK
jgi:NitT/TauT family transport system substrate-binding protein